MTVAVWLQPTGFEGIVHLRRGATLEKLLQSFHSPKQAEHHRMKTFQEEFLVFLDRHGIDYNEKYRWD